MSPAQQTLLSLERAGWDALSTSGEAAAEFFGRILASNVLMLLPGGIVIDDRQQAIEAMRGTPWSTFELVDERIVELGDGVAVVAYRASARRVEGEYTALFNSTYVREDGTWHLVLHQQTPV